MERYVSNEENSSKHTAFLICCHFEWNHIWFDFSANHRKRV